MHQRPEKLFGLLLNPFGHRARVGPALVALEQLKPTLQSRKQMDDIRKLLAANCQPGTINLHLAQAKCRLNPHADRADIYREYGFEDWEV